MTRKDVCKAVGISVKTLRLYEEKGLIAPARYVRNGREYREYSPELVQQLEKIVLLRRALFTMEEILCMQQSPEKIPEVFHGYQKWLDQQTRQFLQLRQAAEQVDTASLDSIDGLLAGLKTTASEMPLPQMDIKPNFKRIDAMEELPRHVEQQVDFDETVPNARVLRQMNLALDHDRANNINVAFGQYNELRQKETWETSGPVQRERKMPVWYRILAGTLTVLLVLSFILCLRQIFDLRRWNLFNLLLILRGIMAGIPVFLEHLQWNRQHAKPDPAETAARRKKRWKIILLGALGTTVVAALVIWLCHVVDRQVNPDRDYQIIFASPANIADRDLMKMEDVLSPLAGDRDGNGEACTAIELAVGTSSSVVRYQGLENPTELWSLLEEGEYDLCFITDLTYQGSNLVRDFKFSSYCRELPEDLTSNINRYRADLTGSGVFAAVELAELTVYGCIPKSATQEQYDDAVELLRKILAQ